MFRVPRSRRLAACCAVAAIAAVGNASPALSQGATNLLNFWRFEPPAVPVGKRGSPSTSTNCLPGSLRAKLAEINRRYGTVVVVSTLRPGARIAGTRRPSLHATCQAVDFRPARGTYGAVASHLRRSWSGGVGTYASGHIHIDTGPNYRWHQGGGRKVARGKRARPTAVVRQTRSKFDRVATGFGRTD